MMPRSNCELNTSNCTRRTVKKSYSLWAPMIAVPVLFLLTGCAANLKAVVKASRAPLINQQGTAISGLGEMRAQAVPAGAGCDSGGLVVTSGGGHPPELLTAALPAGGSLAATAVASDSLQLVPTDNFVSADQHVLRLANGQLYVSWLYSSSAALTPQPDWWDVVAGNGSGLPASSRGSMLQLISKNCGQTWTRLPDLDSAVVDGGKWAWPQGSGADNTTPWIGGWDRQEIYADPFGGRLFATMRATTGTLPQYAAQHADDSYLFLYSDDNGHNWIKSPIQFPAWEPLFMTSTPSGRLFLGHCIGTDQGNRVVVYWIDPKDLGGSAPTGSTVIGNGTGTFNECETLAQDKLGNVTVEYQPLVSLSRMGTSTSQRDTVRVAYPRLENGRQVRFVIGVSVGPDGSALQIPLQVIRATDANGSVLFATFVESDGSDARLTNVAMLYWLETTNGGTLVARYAMVKDGWEWTTPADLSVSNGTRLEWNPDGSWIGHYIRGGFYADASAFRYVALWPENGVPTVNVVSVARDVAKPKHKSARKWAKAKQVSPHAARTLVVAPGPVQDRDGVSRGRKEPNPKEKP